MGIGSGSGAVRGAAAERVVGAAAGAGNETTGVGVSDRVSLTQCLAQCIGSVLYSSPMPL